MENSLLDNAWLAKNFWSNFAIFDFCILKLLSNKACQNFRASEFQIIIIILNAWHIEATLGEEAFGVNRVRLHGIRAQHISMLLIFFPQPGDINPGI